MEPVEGETIRTFLWKMILPVDGFKPRPVHIPAFMDSSAIGAFPLGWSSTPPL